MAGEYDARGERTAQGRSLFAEDPGGKYATGWNTRDYRDGPTSGGDYATEGKIQDDTAWGGYAATTKVGPDGRLVADVSRSGRQDDVNRFNNMANAAANRQAYKNDYTAANGYRAMGSQSRADQNYAANLAGNVARGGPTQAQELARQMVQQGAQAQQAAAMGARGGSLAQAAAMRQQAAGQGAYMQQGAQQVAAIQADEMAQAREQYAQALAQQRAQDYQAAGLSQQQAISQQNNMLGQRQLNDQATQGYRQMAFGTNAAAQDANLRQQEVDAGIYNTSEGAEQADRARNLGYATAGMSAAGTAFRWSDERVKTNIRSLAYAAAARQGG